MVFVFNRSRKTNSSSWKVQEIPRLLKQKIEICNQILTSSDSQYSLDYYTGVMGLQVEGCFHFAS